MSTALSVRWITSLTDLRALGASYDRMVQAAGDVGLFYRTGWVERVWPYYQARLGGELAFLVAERAGAPVALAPLHLRTKDWLHARQRTLGFFGGTTDELDDWVPAFLFAEPTRAAAEECVHAFVDALEVNRSAWDLLDLRFLREGCPGRAVLRSRLPELLETADPLATPRVRIDEEAGDGAARWARYRASRSKRLLRMLDRGARRLEEEGVVARVEVGGRVPLELRAATERIHRARQDRVRERGRPRTSPFEDAAGAETFWGLVDWASSAGHLRAHWLFFDDAPAAFVYALHHAGTSFSWFNAIDPAAERHHPGSLLLARVIEAEVTGHDARVIDLMAGPNVTKELFATESLRHVGMVAANPHRLVARARHAWVAGAKQLLTRAESIMGTPRARGARE